VAELWQEKSGRWPEVHVGAAVAFNHRPPQLLIDPRVDLAGVAYNFIRHNSWIMPLQGKPPSWPQRTTVTEDDD
jgi:hypothetical protein